MSNVHILQMNTCVSAFCASIWLMKETWITISVAI